VAQQIDADPDEFGDYAVREQTRLRFQQLVEETLTVKRVTRARACASSSWRWW
jgi:hypothetical protein